ncbi:tail tubular protein B [Roseobacter phage CRP-114]|uniref:Tail tubular protein B n=1 Tax=Roseobacter phage CRP-114 TaxID=3072842 RepID=A0AAX3ZWL8_9CAUD|nr:tail tubular protein B [Roseobacter phage CRP-114]
MGLISSAIPNLVQGVSQQSPALRLSSQAELMENAFPSLVEGLQKRPPLENVATMSASETIGSFSHLINRDVTERYFVFINASNQISIYDLNGVAKTVTYPDGTSYLNSTAPATDFRAVTVADYTFIVNTSQTTAMSSALTPLYPYTGLIAVKQGDYNQRYTVYLDGAIAANIETSETDQVETRTDDIATKLSDAINLVAGFTARADGSTVVITKTGNAQFDLATYDSLGDEGLSATVGTVQRFDELPNKAPEGYIAHVQGDQTNDFDDYYVKFVSDNGTQTKIGEGTWIEWVEPNIEYEIDASTMPHLLIRQPDGSFTFEVAEWGDRAVGDLTSVPNPSFIGRKITDVFFFQNRLGFLAGENTVMSRTSEYFDFFATTARTLLDNDPIDVAASHTKVSLLKHAIPFDRKLLLFSDQTQFILKGADFITPKNTSISQTTEYEASTLAQPASAGNVVYFPAKRGGFTSIREYYVIDDTDRSDAQDVTAHVAKYVPDGVFKMIASTTENALVCLTTQETNAVYLYKYHWAGREKVQSAWFKYTMNGLNILNAEFIESALYIVGNKDGKTILYKMQFDAGRTDINQDYVTRLDFRMAETDTTRTYDAVSNTTTIVTPYTLTTPVIVTRGTNQGQVIAQTATNGDTLTVSGDRTATEFYVGEAYLMTYEFSEPTMKEPTANGGRVAITGGRLQIKHWLLRYQDSGDFTVKVLPRYRPLQEYGLGGTNDYTGRVIGGGAGVLGTTTLASGDFRFPVMSKADRLSVIIESDSHLPCQFLSAEWEGSMHLRSRRVNG